MGQVEQGMRGRARTAKRARGAAHAVGKHVHASFWELSVVLGASNQLRAVDDPPARGAGGNVRVTVVVR